LTEGAQVFLRKQDSSTIFHRQTIQNSAQKCDQHQYSALNLAKFQFFGDLGMLILVQAPV
jgi:hypothetical protein